MNRLIKAVRREKNKETATGLVQIFFVGVVVVGTIALTNLLQFTAPSGPALSGDAAELVVDIIRPNPIEYRAKRTITGEVEARANVILSPQVSGRVTMLGPKVIPGAILEKDTVLFSIEAADYDIALERARAEVASAQADLLQADADADNFIRDWQRVYPDTPVPDLVSKKPQRDAIKARLAAANAGVRQAELNLERTKVKAPARIRLIESSVDVGQQVVPGGNYGSFYVLDALRIRAGAEVDVITHLGIKAGSKVEIKRGDADQPIFEASVLSIGASLNERTRLSPIVVEAPQTWDTQPGQFVSVRLSGPIERNVLRLPASALVTRTSVWCVENGKLVEVTVAVKDITEDAIIVDSFDYRDGIVVSQVPTSFTARPVRVRRTLSAEGKPNA